MKRLAELLKWIFSQEHRKKQWNEELSFIRDQIEVVERELAGREDFIQSIHEKAADKDSSFEQGRNQARIEEMKYNRWLLVEYLKREKILMKKLKVV